MITVAAKQVEQLWGKGCFRRVSSIRYSRLQLRRSSANHWTTVMNVSLLLADMVALIVSTILQAIPPCLVLCNRRVSSTPASKR